MDRRLFNKKDFFIIIILLLVAGIMYFSADKFIFKESSEAEILYDNKIIQTVELKGNYTFSPDGFPNIIFKVENGKIAFTESDCPDKICINTGFISKTGQTAVCLPNKMILRLKSQKGDIDAVL